MPWFKRAGFALIVLAMALLFTSLHATPLFAHERVEIGPYNVVVGWRQEPPIVGERNALLLIITEGDEPVQGAEATLDAEVMYGGQTFRTNLLPSLTAGEYTAELLPTVRGQYDVHLFGTLGTTPVDVTVAPEEIFPASRIQFPVAPPDVLELQETVQEEIDSMQSQMQTLQWLALAGIALGLVGVGVALVSLRRRQ